MFIHTHANLNENVYGYNSTEWGDRVLYNFRMLGVFIDIRFPCGVGWRSYFGGVFLETDDFFGGAYELITCDGYDLTTHLGGYFAAGMLWMIIGAPLICKMTTAIPDLNDPESMLAMLKRPSRALTGFVTVLSIGSLSSTFHQFVAKGRFEDPSTVDLWLCGFGMFTGGVMPMLPALCCTYCYRLNHARKGWKIHPKNHDEHAVEAVEEFEVKRDKMIKEDQEADEAEEKAAEEMREAREAQEAQDAADKEALDVSLARERLDEAKKTGDEGEIKAALAALEKEEREAAEAAETARKEVEEAELAVAVAGREWAEATAAEGAAHAAEAAADEAGLTREEMLQQDDMLQAQHMAEAEIEDVGPGVSEELRAVFNLMGGRKTGYLTSAQVKRGLRKYLHLKLTRRELKRLVGKQLDDDRLSYPEFVGLVNAGAEAARRAGEADEVLSDSTFSQSNLSAASLSLGLRQTAREDSSPYKENESPVKELKRSKSSKEKTEETRRAEKEAEVAAAETEDNFEVAAQLGALAQQLAHLQEQIVQKQLSLVPEAPRRQLPPLALAAAPPPKRTALDDLSDWFKDVDSDGTGSIDADELRVAMEARLGGYVDKAKVDELIAKADVDQNGQVDWAEFLVMVTEQGWSAAEKEEETKLPTARLLCSADRHWVFNIRSHTRRAILGRMPGEKSSLEDEELQAAREDAAPEERLDLDDLKGERGGVRCILPSSGLTSQMRRKISRRHCEIVLQEENGCNRWVIRCLDGHQILLNGIRITSVDGPAPLQSYDRIGIGPLIMVFHPEGGDESAQLAAQTAFDTAVALTHGVEFDEEQQRDEEAAGLKLFITTALTQVESDLDKRLAAALQKLAPEPEPEPEAEPEVEGEVEEEEKPSGGSQQAAAALVRQLNSALKNYEGYYGPHKSWTAAEKMTVGGLCQQLATAYDGIDQREYGSEHRHRAEQLLGRPHLVCSNSTNYPDPAAPKYTTELGSKTLTGWSD